MNIKLNYTLVGQAEVKQKLLLAYTSGNLPDMMIGMAPYSIGEQWDYVKQGMLIQLDDYIKNYAPNVQRLLKQNAQAKYSITAESHKHFVYTMFSFEHWKDFFFIDFFKCSEIYLSCISAY